MPTQTYQRVMAALASEGPEQWDAIAPELPGFPDGLDDVVHRRWIVNALGTGSAASVRWMLKKASISTFVTAKATSRRHRARGGGSIRAARIAAPRRRAGESQGRQRLDVSGRATRRDTWRRWSDILIGDLVQEAGEGSAE